MTVIAVIRQGDYSLLPEGTMALAAALLDAARCENIMSNYCFTYECFFVVVVIQIQDFTYYTSSSSLTKKKETRNKKRNMLTEGNNDDHRL